MLTLFILLLIAAAALFVFAKWRDQHGIEAYYDTGCAMILSVICLIVAIAIAVLVGLYNLIF